MEFSIGKLQTRNFIIGDDQPVFFVAEIGQNHQGDLEMAKRLIVAAKENGADCVKFQKSELEEKFTRKILEKPYENENSWGKTYGEHKKYLEFTKEEFIELQEYAKKKNILFTASTMDVKSLELLIEIDVPFIKIGSGDNNNIPLLIKAAQSGIPLIISTGMLTFESVQKIVEILKKFSVKKNYALLHCVSSYPTALEDANLKTIPYFRKEFPDIVIGYSGHEIGIEVSIMAAILGAKIIERHITLDQTQRGSDHKCSLLPHQFKQMVDKIKQTQTAMGIPRKTMIKSEIECWKKLGKSLVSAKFLKKGHCITSEDIKVKVADPKGIDGLFYEVLIGKTLVKDLQQDEPLLFEYFI